MSDFNLWLSNKWGWFYFTFRSGRSGNSGWAPWFSALDTARSTRGRSVPNVRNKMANSLSSCTRSLRSWKKEGRIQWYSLPSSPFTDSSVSPCSGTQSQGAVSYTCCDCIKMSNWFAGSVIDWTVGEYNNEKKHTQKILIVKGRPGWKNENKNRKWNLHMTESKCLVIHMHMYPQINMQLYSTS